MSDQLSAPKRDWRYYYYELGTAKECRIKSDWKRKGLKDDTSLVFDIYKEATECEICHIELTEDAAVSVNKKVMNHCHKTGYFNNILCWSCNIHEHYNSEKFNEILEKNLLSVAANAS
tara:strand:- start:1753 stop:2106 length:354 start_codon:yes stop_codon:yes gene_type:complete